MNFVYKLISVKLDVENIGKVSDIGLLIYFLIIPVHLISLICNSTRAVPLGQTQPKTPKNPHKTLDDSTNSTQSCPHMI